MSAAQHVDDVFEPLVLLSCRSTSAESHHALIVETQMLSGELGVLGQCSFGLGADGQDHRLQLLYVIGKVIEGQRHDDYR